ncbi:MAG: Flp family type IVb pilin [Deltaproteobacteria bacterium]|nr:Flp family type IVb pilin [Deltaproteobacteria bacterium]
MILPREWSRFVWSESGAASVEYGLLMAGIFLVIFATVLYLGEVISTNFYGPAEELIR